MHEYGWWALIESREVRDAPLGVRRLGRELVFWRRADGSVVCQEDLCPHRRTKLSLGKVKDDCIECPFHGMRFAHDGACSEIPAYRGQPERIPETLRVRAYATLEAHGFVFVWADPRRPPTAAPPWFKELDASYVFTGFASDWQTHFSRAIENQLDFAHLPFVHASTIGRFATVGVEPETETDDGLVRFDFAGGGGFIEWREPNIWLNDVGFGFVFVAFAPIDEENTRMYLRFYQNKVRAPGLRHLFHALLNPFNRVVLRQDQAVVQAQTPKDTHGDIGEVLVPFDRPVVAYRAQRARRLRAGAQAARASGSQGNKPAIAGEAESKA